MIIKNLSALTEPTKGALEPVQKFNQQTVAAVEKLTTYQLESLKTYSDMGVSQLKAVAELKDTEGLQKFISKQTDVLRTFSECVLSDLKAVTQIGVDFLSQTAKVGAKTSPVTPEKIEVA
jgi:phasin family protein